MPTAARPISNQSSHWYYPDGKPCYEVERADGQGKRPTTLRDARKLGLLPSVTTILQVLRKPALEAWLTEQACLAVLTAPKLPDEQLDAFVERVLHTEKQQDAESQKARDLGTDIHNAIEQSLGGFPVEARLVPFVEPVVKKALEFGRPTATEKIIVGSGYAGKTDLICETDTLITVLDFKTCKKLPKQSWDEHLLQLSAYAAGLGNTGSKLLITANIYITTAIPSEIAVFTHQGWQETFERGFKPLLQHWKWANNY